MFILLLLNKSKSHVKTLPCLGIPTVSAFKIVETNTFDIGYGGILKRVLPDSSHSTEQIYIYIYIYL